MASSPRHSRRDFLQGKAAAQTLAEAAEKLAPAPTARQPGSPAYLVGVRRRAMACDFQVQFPAHRDPDPTEHALAALDLVESLEDQMTVYRETSELIETNRHAATEPVAVEPRLFDVLCLAAKLHRETGGALDITSGPLSKVWGFWRRQGRLPSDEEIGEALTRVGMDQVVFDQQARTVSFRRPGVELNLNSMGKGYALDRAAELLAETGVENFLLHGGRSSVLARGRNPAEPNAAWSVGLRDPFQPERRLAEIFLRDQALATSGSATQFFHHEGRHYGHILDPRSGRPVEGKLTVTVIAPTAVEADALSTAFYIMNLDQIDAFCSEHPQIRAILVCPAGDGPGEQPKGMEECQLLAFGLGDDEWRRLGQG